MSAREENISFGFIVLSHLLVLFLRLMVMTWRFRIEGAEHRQAAIAAHPHGALIIGIWHENICASILSHAGQPFHTVVSRSRDGEFVAHVLASLGMESIRGSSSRGGAAALLEVKRKLDKGGYSAMAVDGPRGPRRVAKAGIIEAARLCGTPILPLAAIAKSYWRVRSWDRFRIPKPFTSITVRYGAPIAVPRRADPATFEEYRRLLDKTLDALELDLVTEESPAVLGSQS